MKLNARQKRVILKCAEELNELSTVLLQEINKRKCKYNDIVAEMQDVESRVMDLRDLLMPERNYPNCNPKDLILGDAKKLPF